MTRIQLRHDTATNWTTANPILAEGEVGVETDTNKMKIGDGVTSWNSLAYFVGDIDGITITKNSDDELQTVGVIDQNNTTNAIKTWTGTKAQYNAIVTKDATTLYNIVDDTDTTLTLLELLFPVGAVYFGTMSTCPLQTLGVGTWQALPPDKVIQIAGTRGNVGTTINESLPNIKGSFKIAGANAFNKSGCFYDGASYQSNPYGGSSGNGNAANFDASRSSSTYQDNAPVQPDAYLLNGWRRIA